MKYRYFAWDGSRLVCRSKAAAWGGSFSLRLAEERSRSRSRCKCSIRDRRKNERMAVWYGRFGAMRLVDDPLRLVLPLKIRLVLPLKTIAEALVLVIKRCLEG
jgi:hypothetical protein